MEISFFPQSYQYASAVQSDRPQSNESQEVQGSESTESTESSETSKVDVRV